MPLSYIPHIPVTASPRCTFSGLYHGTNHIESAIQSHTHPLFVHTVQEQYLSSLSSLSATWKAGTHFHVTSRLRLHLLKIFHGPISGYYFTKHGDLRLQECYQPDIGYMHRTGEKFHSLATCAKAGCVTCQPCDDATQFIRSSNAAQRIQIRPFLKEVGLRIEIRCRHT